MQRRERGGGEFKASRRIASETGQAKGQWYSRRREGSKEVVSQWAGGR